MLRKFGVIVLAVAAVAGGYFLGRGEWGGGSASFTCPKAGAKVSDDVDRKCVPLAGTAKGAANAVVSIVEFSDFQCPFCSRVVPTIEQLVKAYPDKVRVFFKQNPLPFHDKAGLAAEAALAAGEQGKFWEMHDKLFANQQALDRASLDKYAGELGLDANKFKAALDAHTFKAAVDKDMALAKELGVQGTPNFFINGRLLSGAQPFDSFKRVVEDEIARADKLMAKGTSRGQVYAALMRGDGKGTGSAAPAAPQPAPRPTITDDLYKVEVGSAPVRGGKEPKVTLIEFSEFQCPFCKRASGTLDELLKIYKDDLQIAFRHYPLPFHDNAMPAAIAAEAAKAQGKFWEMYDKLFANQQALGRADLEKYAGEIGLDVAKFKAAMDDPKTKAGVEADMKLANQFAVQGTPSFFINGRAFSGAYPLESFKMLMDEELKKADAKLQAGTPRAELYAAIIKGAAEKRETPKEPTRPGEPVPGQAYKAEIKGAPVKGAVKDALVTIVQYSDFQCPYCKRVEPTIDKVMEEYKGKVRVAWRNMPLPFHDKAMPAAIAATAAAQQGKFWEMHSKLFENQQALDDASIEKYAREIPGLNFDKWKAAKEDKKTKAAVEAESAAGSKIGARGTPAFFVNGVFLSGARPFEQFKSLIDAQLTKAEELVKKGTPKAKVYDAILKTAKADVGGGKDEAAAADAGPAKQIDVGTSPSKGPKNAPLTVVVFSDFQCPFCSRVEPSVTQLEKNYPGKVRVVWKNYPLAFHDKAKGAAEAAMAAGEQGKFWEMHDLLFKNQQALDPASLEKYAQELKLDMGKWKAAVETHKYAAQIDADMKQGTQVGVSGTPATFINGRLISGAVPYSEFQKVADEEMAKLAKGGKKKAAVPAQAAK